MVERQLDLKLITSKLVLPPSPLNLYAWELT